MSNSKQNQPSEQHPILTSEETKEIKQIKEFVFNALRQSFDNLETDEDIINASTFYSLGSKSQNVNELYSRLQIAENELRKVEDLCNNLLIVHPELTPDEIYYMSLAIEMFLERAEANNRILATDKADLTPFYNIQDKIQSMNFISRRG